jgi:hypothetical protein
MTTVLLQLPLELLCEIAQYCTRHELLVLTETGVSALAWAAVVHLRKHRPLVKRLVEFCGVQLLDSTLHLNLPMVRCLIGRIEQAKLPEPRKDLITDLIPVFEHNVNPCTSRSARGLFICVVGVRGTGKTVMAKRIAHTMIEHSWCNEVHVVRNYQYVTYEYGGWKHSDDAHSIPLDRGNMVVFDDFGWTRKIAENGMQVVKDMVLSGVSVLLILQYGTTVRRLTKTARLDFDFVVSLPQATMTCNDVEPFQHEPKKLSVIRDIMDEVVFLWANDCV